MGCGSRQESDWLEGDLIRSRTDKFDWLARAKDLATNVIKTCNDSLINSPIGVSALPFSCVQQMS
jgi:hypothetical protein